jgi:protein-L-isoaspartate(D-aspartate) O-methyltransferase
VQVVAATDTLGLPERGPFDAIHVGASCAVVPTVLVQQLKLGARMVINVGSSLLCVTRLAMDKDIRESPSFDVACVYSGLSMTALVQSKEL